MRRFTYVGEGNCVAYGLHFPRGVPVTVDDSDPVRLRKIAANQFFAEVLDGVEVLDAPVKRGPGRPRKDRP